jgi:hypothetical protein
MPDLLKRGNSPGQFTIRALLATTALFAVALSINACTHGMLWRMIAPRGLAGYSGILFLLASVYCAVTRCDLNNVVGLALIGWGLVLTSIVTRLLDCFPVGCFTPTTATASDMMPIYRLVVSGVTLPVLLSIPVIHAVLSDRGTHLSRGNRWCVLGILIALSCVFTTAQTYVSVFGYQSTSRGSAREWTFGPY